MHYYCKRLITISIQSGDTNKISQETISSLGFRQRHGQSRSNRFVRFSSAPHISTINTALSFFSVTRTFLSSPQIKTTPFSSTLQIINYVNSNYNSQQRHNQQSIIYLTTQRHQPTTVQSQNSSYIPGYNSIFGFIFSNLA